MAELCDIALYVAFITTLAIKILLQTTFAEFFCQFGMVDFPAMHPCKLLEIFCEPGSLPGAHLEADARPLAESACIN